MAAGKPVVATRCGGPEEIVIEGETGFLIPPDSPEEMAKKILYLIDNPEKSAKLGIAGRKRFEAHFTADKYYETVERHYAEVISAPRRVLKGEDEKLARSLMELVIGLNDNRVRLRAGFKKRVLLFVIYIRQYIEIFFTQGFSAANKKTFGFLSDLFKNSASLKSTKVLRP